MDAQLETVNMLHIMDNDQLLSLMTLADREQRFEDFVKFRREIMYRLRCATPLLEWQKPLRVEDEL